MSYEEKEDLSSEKVGFDLKFIKRFYKIHKIFFSNCLSYLPFTFLLIISLLEEVIVYFVGLIPSKFYKILAEKNLEGFIFQTLISIGIIVGVSLTKSTKQFIQNILQVFWRKLVCLSLHDLYFYKINYYIFNSIDKSIDNPDQRITQEVDKLTSTYCDVLPKIIVSPFIISYYSYITFLTTGWPGPLACFGFFILGTLVNKLIMSPIVRFVIKLEQREGDFRFVHMQVRVNSESIAFHDAGKAEIENANKSLNILIKTQFKLFIRQYILNSSVNLYNYLGTILSFLILAFPIFNGAYDDLTPSELAELISKNAFVSMYLIFTFTNLIQISRSMTDIAGSTHRICQMMERLLSYNENEKDEDSTITEIIDSNDNEHSQDENDKEEEPKSSKFKETIIWTINNVSFAPPLSDKFQIKNLNIKINLGENILITGPSSSGKTSFLRILRGLWNYKGNIKSSLSQCPSKAYFCPQKPFLTNGTLREQLNFPVPSEEANDDKIHYYINLLKLNSLLERIGGLDKNVPWTLYESLSPGEIQRICFIRAFLQRPIICLFDESSSALPSEIEEIIYEELVNLGITFISVAHRMSLRKFHQKELNFDNDGWTFSDLTRN